MTLRFPSTNTQFSNFTKPGIDRPITWRILRFSGTFAMLMRPWTFPRTQRFRQWLLEPLMSLSQRNGMWPLLIVVMLRQPSLLLRLGLLKKNFLLAEPWTVVLIQSFAKAGHILLNEADASPNTQNDPLGQSWLQCRYCLEALWCLGRKFKKKALLAARDLSSSEAKFRERHSQSYIVAPEFAVDDGNFSTIPDGYDIEIPI